MASYRCGGCGRTNFFTSHGLAKHQRKCARKARGLRVTTGWDDSRPTKYQQKDRTMGSGNRYSRAHVEAAVERFHGDVAAAIRAGVITEEDYGRYEASLY